MNVFCSLVGTEVGQPICKKISDRKEKLIKSFNKSMCKDTLPENKTTHLIEEQYQHPLLVTSTLPEKQLQSTL